MTEEKILLKVRKLLALANDTSTTEAERDQALKFAHDLLAKHELDMKDVEESMREKEDPRMQFKADGWNAKYAGTIRRAMSNLFRCFYCGGRKINATRSEFYFVGRESAATTAMFMSEWIIKATLREADRRYGHRLNPEGRSFCVGVADRLYHRVLDIVEAKQTEFGTALVLFDVAKREYEANKAFLIAAGWTFPDANAKTKMVRAVRVEGKAYGAGIDHANTINLNTQISNQKEQTKLGR